MPHPSISLYYLAWDRNDTPVTAAEVRLQHLLQPYDLAAELKNLRTSPKFFGMVDVQYNLSEPSALHHLSRLRLQSKSGELSLGPSESFKNLLHVRAQEVALELSHVHDQQVKLHKEQDLLLQELRDLQLLADL